MHSTEISDLQLTMAKQEAVIECQKNELKSLGEKFDEKTSQLDQSSQDCARMTEEISVIQKRLTESTTVCGKHKVVLATLHVAVLWPTVSF